MRKLLPKRPFSMRAMAFFSLLLMIKSYLAWYVIFESGPSWNTVLKELPFVLTVFCLIEGFAKKRKLFYYFIVNFLFTLIFFAVMMYYKYYGVIATYKALDQVNQVTAVTNSVFSLIYPHYLLIFSDIVVIGALLLRHHSRKGWKWLSLEGIRPRVLTLVFVLSVGLCLLNILPNRASMNEIVKASEMGILNYEAYSLFSGHPETAAAIKENVSQEQINELKGIRPVDDPQYRGVAKGRNLIMIQMESLQSFLIGLTIGGEEVTPVLNELAGQHFYFPHFYQQVGQGNTSDAEFVVNTSLYIPASGAASGEYAGKELPSLPKLLADEGYYSATFHTNIVEFWNRGELYRALGFNRYYDKAFFGDEDKVFFGASDETLYAKTAAELELFKLQGVPFYAHVISMTAHHPFTIPEDKHLLELPEPYEGTLLGDYIRAQKYADYALGKFIDDLKARGLWEDSLIVIYGDHLGLPKFTLTQEEKDLLQTLTGKKYGYEDMLNVPLLVIAEGVTHPAVFPQTGGQVDLLPTVANLLGVSLDGFIHFGQDLLNHYEYNLLPQRYYMPTGSFLNHRCLFVSGSGFADGEVYPLGWSEPATVPAMVDAADAPGAGESPAAKEPESWPTSLEEFERALELLRLSDSYAVQLPDRQPPAEPSAPGSGP